LQVQIVYDTTPVFGIHQNVRGTIFTSQLPKTTQHWLPVIDHPRTEFTTEIQFTHPTGYTVVASGSRGVSELLNIDEETVVFSSNRPVPATSLAWVLGNFSQSPSTADSDQGMQGVDFNTFRTFRDESNTNIHFYSESDDDISLITENAINAYLSLKEYFGEGSPFNDLHVIVMDDHFWETKNYGAGIIYLFNDAGSVEDQVRRGMLAQWIGVPVREIQWSDADAILALQAVTMNRLFEFNTVEGDVNGQYDNFGAANFSRWLNFLNQQEAEHFTSDLSYTKEEGLLANLSLLSWNTLSEQIYHGTGQPYFGGFTPDAIETESAQEYVYRATVEWEEGASTAQVRFEADQGAVDELVTVIATEETFTGERTHEMTFSGRSESVVINVSSGIENLKFTISDRDDIKLYESKPFMFWLHQLRSSDDISRRVAAASGISEFTDNPDLQLALNDLLQMESNPEVYAEIIRSMGKLTRGASGTDERFIQNSSVNQHRYVQLAAVEVLAYYEGNERVSGRLRTVINQTEYSDIRKAAIYSLFEISESSEFRSAVQSFVTREAVLDEVPLLLELLGEKGEREAAVELAETFLAPEFSFKTRKGVLDIMLRFDEAPSNWNERLPALLADSDPRIRYRAADALERLNSQQRSQIISDRIDDEFDARVYRKLR
ncbi:MAG: hypothetical protein JJU37_11730, partial [Balneolaceae bacterium]|nr:hypothetical protein [Balneolaceae bacterium]